jgi:hypothetical protein
MTKLPKIKVKSGHGDSSRVALYEKHPEHPNGEVFIANRLKADGKWDYPEVEVAKTPEVNKRLRNGALVEVQGFAQKVMEPFKSEEEDKPKRGK